MADFNDKIIELQSKLKAPKGQYNAHSNFYYRSCEDILAAAKPICESIGLSIRLSDEVQEVGGRVFIQATATVTDGENEVSAKAVARETLARRGFDDGQLTGCASSYARKYALNGLFAIDDVKDADNDPPIDADQKITGSQLDTIESLIRQLPQNRVDAFLEWLGISQYFDITISDYGRALNALKQAVSKEKAAK